MKWWDQMPWSSYFECWALSQLFSLSSFTFIKRLFSSSSLSATGTTKFPSYFPGSRSLLILQVCGKHWATISVPMALLTCCLTWGNDFSNTYVLSTKCFPSTVIIMRDSRLHKDKEWHPLKSTRKKQWGQLVSHRGRWQQQPPAVRSAGFFAGFFKCVLCSSLKWVPIWGSPTSELTWESPL